MTIVVTGASGHLGNNLVRALLARGERVRAVIHRDDRALQGLEVERVQADICNADAVRRAVGGASLVYHLAARISIVGPQGGAVERINVGGARNVAEAALAEGVRMVHVSSIHAFQQAPKDEPLDERRARVPFGDRRWPAYDQTKAEGERVVRQLLERGLDAVILHPTGVIGRHDYAPSRMGHVFLDLWHRRLPSLVPGGFDFVDVRDVTKALLAAADPARGRRGESYLLTGHWRTVAELAAAAAAITGRPAPRLTTPSWLAHAGAPVMTLWAKLTGGEPLYTAESLEALQSNRDMRSDKARVDLGHSPPAFEESVLDTYVWHREVGNIPREAGLVGG
jgi:dihydroflavonol-4-reductase